MSAMEAERPAAPPLLEVRGLAKHFPIRRGLLRRAAGVLRAVDGVDLTVGRRETLALVGESGCGKTTTGRALLRLHEPTAGSALWRGEPDAPAVDLFRVGRRRLRGLRRELQVVFQDPYGSLNPRLTVGAAVGEALEVHRIARGAAARERVARLFEEVGLHAELAGRFPHELSGGQRQRVGIARALAVEPRLLVCDEAVSALDVSVQAQILNLFVELRERLDLAYLFIAHDLSVVRVLADRVAVMLLGRIVEEAPAGRLFEVPYHPYTQALLSAIPVPDPRRVRARLRLVGELPSAASPPAGCRFHTRCPLAEERCRAEPPLLREIAPGHRVACHLAEPGSPPRIAPPAD